ncbi:MAG: hypothetical protein Q7S52_00765 [bacterium]|nr:hypothetical protein [bacterium]
MLTLFFRLIGSKNPDAFLMYRLVDMAALFVLLVVLAYGLPFGYTLLIVAGILTLTMIESWWIKARLNYLFRDPCWKDNSSEGINKRQKINERRKVLHFVEEALSFFDTLELKVYLIAIALGLVLRYFLEISIR